LISTLSFWHYAASLSLRWMPSYTFSVFIFDFIGWMNGKDMVNEVLGFQSWFQIPNPHLCRHHNLSIVITIAARTEGDSVLWMFMLNSEVKVDHQIIQTGAHGIGEHCG
jgi:hypothetical protein